jgi:acetyltransferase-like isoleucine patch superfamily enzyme
MRGREKFSKYKGLINTLSSFYKILPQKVRIKLLFRHRRINGKIGMAIRYALLKSIAVECGDNVAIYEDVYFFNPQNLFIGNNVSLHPMCYVECGNSKDKGLHIGNDVSIAHGVTIMSNTHPFNNENILIKDQPVITKQILIGSNVWIGAKASILAGVSINSGCVIGANAVVTKDIEENKVCAGVPAKVIKERL